MSTMQSSHAQSEAKRRKLRKGTHSCWECKRRKMKCVFDAPTDTTTCTGCRRRGSQCVSQEYVDKHARPMHEAHKMGAGAARVETLITNSDGSTCGRRSTTPSGHRETARHGIPTPVSISSNPSRYLTFYKSAEQHRAVENGFVSASGSKYERLSQFLHESLPSREDTERICTASHHPSVLAHEIMTMPYTTLDQSGLVTPEILLDIPQPTLHPVLIARHMLLLATFLQHLHPGLHNEIKGLLESPRAIMERLAELAANFVTTNDDLIGSIEGLECIMIESVYQANIGNLRRSWVVSRRAMSIAQLMGLNRSHVQAQYKVLDPKTKYHPELMWFRIVFMDRYLCLMLGLSQGCLDRSMASGPMFANDTPMGRLERTHCVIASRILERNESDPSSDDLTLTRTLDTELRKAASTLPSKWWLIPDLDISSTDSQDLFWNTRRLIAQVFHYNLLNQLHLPYMLRSSSPKQGHEYSRITCVNASREILSRFIALRKFNGIAYSCRTVDFLALMAAMTILLAHLDSHVSEPENLLAHQYHGDRAIVEKVQENMQELNRLNSDALSAQGAELLCRLLTIDVETADGNPPCARRVSVHKAGSEIALSDQGDVAVVSVHIPYFGIIKIAREGISKDANLPPLVPDSHDRTQAQPETLSIPHQGTNNVSTQFAPQLQNGFDPLLQQGDLPEMAAGADDWAFQGVDWVFFENLMRGTGNEDDESAEWPAILEVNMNR